MHLKAKAFIGYAKTSLFPHTYIKQMTIWMEIDVTMGTVYILSG